MGTFNHQVIVVVGAYNEIEMAHRKATEIYPFTSSLLRSYMNGFCSFMLGPDGSKEGWDVSNEKEDLRSQFIEWLKKNDSYLHWCVINFPEQMKPWIETHKWKQYED